MQKTFLSNLVLLLVVNILIKPLWTLGIEVNVQRSLGPEVYGNYFALLNFAFLFTILMDFGLINFNNRRVSRNPHRMAEYLQSLGTLKLLLAVLFIAVVQTVAHLVGFTPEQIRLLWGISTIVLLQSLLLFLRSNISGIQWYRADVYISVLDRTVSIILCAILIWGGLDEVGLTIQRFVLVQIIAYVVGIIVSLVLLSKKIEQFHFRFQPKEAFKVLKESFFYALLGLLMLSYYRIDAVMIERLLVGGDREAGLYAQAYKLLEASIIFAYLFSTLLLPMFSRMIKGREELQPLIRLADQLLLVPAAVLAIGAAFFGQELMDLLYTEGTQESAEVFTLLILSLIPIAATYIYGTLITAKGDLKTLNIIAGIGLLINVMGNAILIPSHGIYGAAIMTLVTQTMVCLIQVVVAHRMFDLSVKPAGLFKAILTLLALPLLAWSLNGILGDWRLEFVAFIVVSMILASVLGLFSVKKLLEIIRMREDPKS